MQEWNKRKPRKDLANAAELVVEESKHEDRWHHVSEHWTGQFDMIWWKGEIIDSWKI